MLWKRRRLKTVPRTVFAIQGSVLTLSGDGFPNPRTVQLADLLEVYLDLFLTQERVSHIDANEWFSKIRRFLRKHGWLPEDER